MQVSNKPMCPECKMGNSYFNNSMFLCPDCGCEWSDDEKKLTIFEYLNQYYEFNELMELNVPFFKLEHGKLYDCKVKHERGIEVASIIPLAFKNNKNIQFIMIEARKLFTANPQFVREIILMDYEYIYNDGIKADYPSDYGNLTTLCATQEDETLIGNFDIIYYDFIKTTII